MRLPAVLAVLFAAASALAKATEDPFADARDACGLFAGADTMCTFSVTGTTTSKCECSPAQPGGGEDPFADARKTCEDSAGDGTVCTFSTKGASTSLCDCRPAPEDPFADARKACEEFAGADTVCTLSITGATTSKCECNPVKTLRGGGAKLPDTARVVHRWRPAVCKRAKLGKACPLGITTFADGHAAVELLGIKLPQALGNAVARAVGRALPKGVADDVAP